MSSERNDADAREADEAFARFRQYQDKVPPPTDRARLIGALHELDMAVSRSRGPPATRGRGRSERRPAVSTSRLSAGKSWRRRESAELGCWSAVRPWRTEQVRKRTV